MANLSDAVSRKDFVLAEKLGWLKYDVEFSGLWSLLDKALETSLVELPLISNELCVAAIPR